MKTYKFATVSMEDGSVAIQTWTEKTPRIKELMKDGESFEEAVESMFEWCFGDGTLELYAVIKPKEAADAIETLKKLL